MESTALKELRSGFETAYIDNQIVSGEILRPAFLTNNVSEGKKVIQSIEDELLNCDEYKISVAFITGSGITPLLQTLRELDEKGIKGSILTTNYLCFSEPSAIERLNSLKNVTVRLYDVDSAGVGFHSKGYIFKKNGMFRIIIGSSNMTQAALSINKEWNTRIVATEQGEVVQEILNEFNDLWNSKYTLRYEDFFEKYSQQYNIVKNQRQIALQQNPISLAQYALEPNSMQVGFISNLREIVANGERKALLISATGTGKTYASAFAMRELGYKKVLFVVHKIEIVKQARKSFENVFGNRITTGYWAGIGDREEGYNADYVFATVESLISRENYRKFDKTRFDCCILDEAHKAVTESYRKLMEYFTPQLFLGMTATPDRRDDNNKDRNVYETFDHNIAYEIRLQRAMEERLLCPFHYFGIKDLNVITDDKNFVKEKPEEFRHLTCDERVQLISNQARYFGYSGDRVKGLIFCSGIKEAYELSDKLCKFGYKAKALSGKSTEKERENAIDLLKKRIDVSNARTNVNGVVQYPDEEYLDYIITRDIFSEGVDIVEVNQIIMLRPTQSPIVFIQQLGRGLRKAVNKEYVVVLDFIANYKNNYMIPIALSGDRTYNKDNIRRYLMDGNKAIKGECSVHFDEISRKKIYEAIDRASFSDLKLIKENYANLKYKLGRIPSLSEFDEFGEMDVQCIFNNKKLKSYYNFLVDYEKLYKIRITNEESEIIEFISTKIANGKRIHELELLKIMLDTFNVGYTVGLFKELDGVLSSQYGKTMMEHQKKNIVNILTNEFPTGSSKSTYKNCVLIEPGDNGDYVISKRFHEMLSDSEFYKMVRELVDFGMNRNKRDYSNTYSNTDFVLYKKYTYEDVCRLLNWKHNEVPLNIGGYKFDSDTKTYPVFINYEKGKDISATIQYGDCLENRGELVAISKSGRKISSDDVQNFLYAPERGIQVNLFIRKNSSDDTSKEFYYLGHMKARNNPEEFVMENTTKTAVKLHWILDTPIEQDLYEYITSND